MFMKLGYNTVLAVLSGVLAVFCYGCGRPGEHVESMPLERLDFFIADYDGMSDADRAVMADSMMPGICVYSAMTGMEWTGVDSVMAQLSSRDYVRVFTPDVKARFLSDDSIAHVAGLLNRALREKFPAAAYERLFAIVSPYRQSIVTADSLRFIALNHYLGADYPGYAGFGGYERLLKTPRHLPYDLAKASIAVAYPYEGGDTFTVLSRMLYEGALVNAVMMTVPDADLAETLGYSDDQLAWVEANERNLWERLVSRQLIYSTSELDAMRLVAPAPVTSVLHPDAPGRVGRYIGYRILRSYIDRAGGVTPEETLLPDFYGRAENVLIKSEYAP